MSIWHNQKTAKEINSAKTRSMLQHIGIEFKEISDDSLTAIMPVDERTKQPYGIMHGGASAALAETVASVAANLTLDPTKERAVGLELTISHLKMVKSGWVKGVAKPLKLGSTIQVWKIKISNEEGDLVSFSKLSLMVLKVDERLLHQKESDQR